MSKKEVKRIVTQAAADLVYQACSSEIFMHKDYSEADQLKLIQALRELSAELYVKADKMRNA